MKKLLAVLLVLCLFVGMMPMMAFATDDVADTQQENFENTDVLNEGSPGDQSGNSDPSGGDQIGGDQSRGDQDSGNDPAIPDYNKDGKVDDYDKSVHSGGYNPGSINCYQELLNALSAKANPLALGGLIALEDDITIDYNLRIDGDAYNWRGFSGTHTITIKDGVRVAFRGLNVTAPVYVEYGATFVNNASTVENITYEPAPEPDPVYYTVTFDVYPRWATVTVTDANGANVTVKNNSVTLEEGKVYNYRVSAPGFVDGTGEIRNDGDIKVWLSQSDKIVIWPYSHGYVDYWISHSKDWAGVRVEPDSGYYLDDLTIYKVGGGTVNYGHWRDNIYYFPLYAGEQYIIDADFASAPSEYRVYVDSSILHGDVSVDTRYAEEGEWVYITVNPNAGYRLSDLTVTRPSGNTVKVEHVRGNVFRFAMPGVRVTVDAEFVRTTMPFTDVSRGQWFYDAVSFVYWRDIMDGVTSTQFAPDATTTRAMVVQILYRMAGSPTVRGSSPFYDVSNGAWYADAVIWAEANDIVNGMTTTTFAPNTAVTREQLATMLYRYAQYRHYNTSAGANTNILSYYDANRISEYAFSALQWACGEGIMDGTGTGYLSPQGQATRAQLAAMLMRFCMEYRI